MEGAKLLSGGWDFSVRRVIEQSLRRNWSRLFGYAMRLSGDRDSAGDLVQTSALKALSSDSPPRETEATQAWLFRIVRNTWIDEHRRALVRQPVEPAEAFDGTLWSYDDGLIAEITVRQGMARLAPDHRAVIEMIDLQGMRYADAAAALDVPVGTIMSRLSRARLALLEAIEGDNVRPIVSGRSNAKR
jgi:RNA polymerase sigma-70 factor, ECF subfamily